MMITTLPREQHRLHVNRRILEGLIHLVRVPDIDPTLTGYLSLIATSQEIANTQGTAILTTRATTVMRFLGMTWVAGMRAI